MMTSDYYTQAFVWIWLPNEVHPVVAGKLELHDGELLFNYGKSYLARKNAISIYEEELPLKPGELPLLSGLNMPGCIRDASPDAWGRRVIINKKLGFKGVDIDTDQLDELTYLFESGSDRIGALDFQHSATEYVPRLSNNASLSELLESAERVEKGVPLSPELDQAMFHGSSIGGARPKALIEDENKKYIAKFSSNTDLYSVIKAEFIAMKLAKYVGLNVASVSLVKVGSKDVLLVERFDRIKKQNGWQRKILISVLTLLGLHEMIARYASYESFAERIRHTFINPKESLKELFSRMVFNILCGNTDDHARNHAAFWDGHFLSLTPAYDICPQARSGNIASQAMLIVGNNNLSQIKVCLDASNQFMLSKNEAWDIVIRQKDIIEKSWTNVCAQAELSKVDQNLLWKRQFLNPFAFESLQRRVI